MRQFSIKMFLRSQITENIHIHAYTAMNFQQSDQRFHLLQILTYLEFSQSLSYDLEKYVMNRE